MLLLCSTKVGPGSPPVPLEPKVAADAGSGSGCDGPSLSTGELHITPLTGILQMRPSFSYLDKADSKSREREAANEGGLEINLLNPDLTSQTRVTY